MSAIPNHYDNLKVARNAPVEVIRAAYKTLAQRYHPDRNPGNAEAAKIMTIINSAYEVLSDPTRRREHDEWIARQEANAGVRYGSVPPEASPRKSSAFVVDESLLRQATGRQAAQSIDEQLRNPNYSFWDKLTLVFGHIVRNWFWYGVGAFVLVAALEEKKPYIPPPGPKPYTATPPAAKRPEYVRPVSAPNGQPWPATAGYIAGIKKLKSNGRSSVEVDNTQNSSDVFVKLVSLDGEKAFPVRSFFIPGHASFKVKNVTAGNYDVRYRNLDTGTLSRSEAFELHEKNIDGGVRFSNITMTLYKVQHGNMQTFGLSEDEF